MNVLFVSYFFDPDPNVGAKRMSYWAQNFKKHVPNAKVSLITATKNPSEKGLDQVYVTKETSKPLLSYLIKDHGIAWSRSICSILRTIDLSAITHVVISGGPFMQFALAKWIKKRAKTKVILDYRDPFAVNPRFHNSGLKVSIKKWFEGSFNRNADLVLSVNKYCLQLLEGYRKFPEKFKVVRNGYDERSIPRIECSNEGESDKVKLVYAGSFYEDRNPEKLIELLRTHDNAELYHVGNRSKFLEDKKRVIELGPKSYEETLKAISMQDVGLIITSGEPFESTTKIYDYIATKRPILVITSGRKNTGAIEDELKNYPTVWAENNVEDIKQALSRLKGTIFDYKIEVEKYSRKERLKELIERLKHLS